MKRCWSAWVVTAALVTTACAARVPVLIDPKYPDYLFPTVPAEYRGGAVARNHNEDSSIFPLGDLGAGDERYEAPQSEKPEFFLA